MSEAVWTSLAVLFSWPYILYPVVGTLLSMLFAGLPGIGGATLMALALPFVFGMDPIAVMLLLGAFVGGGTFMGSVGAILLGIPGKPANAATVLDGFPMAQQGRAKTAIGCAATASALGSTIGVAALLVLLPLLHQVIPMFGPTEFLALGVWGLITVVLVTKGSVAKGLVAVAFGLTLTFIGTDPKSGDPRLTLGSEYLQDGLDLVLIFLGVFSLAEVIDLVLSGKKTISGKQNLEELSGSVWEGCRSIFQHFPLFLKSSTVGTAVGMIPGVGGMIGGYVAYGLAVRSAGDDSSRFGDGDIRGVLAPEAANDAKDGGTLAPALLFGIPSGASTALLLVALKQMGIAPGRELVTQHMDFVLLLVFSLFFSNWLTSILGVMLVRPFAWLTVAPVGLLTPLLAIVTVVGAFVYRGRAADVALVCIFGLVGYAMKKYDWPRVAFVTALVLGDLIETNFVIASQLHQLGRVFFWERPITLVLLAMTATSIALLRTSTSRRKPSQS